MGKKERERIERSHKRIGLQFDHTTTRSETHMDLSQEDRVILEKLDLSQKGWIRHDRERFIAIKIASWEKRKI